MSSCLISIHTPSSKGESSHRHVIHASGSPLKISAQAHTRMELGLLIPQPEGSAPAPKAPAKPPAHFKLVRQGDDLLLQSEDEAWVQVSDYFVTEGATLGQVTWQFVEPSVMAQALAQAALSPEGSSALDLAAVGISGTGTGVVLIHFEN